MARMVLSRLARGDAQAPEQTWMGRRAGCPAVRPMSSRPALPACRSTALVVDRWIEVRQLRVQIRRLGEVARRLHGIRIRCRDLVEGRDTLAAEPVVERVVLQPL